MKKILKYLKQNIIGFVVGGIVFGGFGTCAAVVISASNIGYSDTNDLGADNVQEAIDKLNIKADNQYFDIATAKANTAGTVFASKKGVCISRSKTVYCFKINNWNVEKDHLRQVFSDVNCTYYSDGYVDCIASDFYCRVGSFGGVFCYDQSDNSYCYTHADGSVDYY